MSHMAGPNGLLTPEEAAAYLRVSMPTIYDWLHRGIVPARRMGRLWRIPRHALQEYDLGSPQLSAEPAAPLRALQGGQV